MLLLVVVVVLGRIWWSAGLGGLVGRLVCRSMGLVLGLGLVVG